MTSSDPGAYAFGVATLTLDGTVLDVWYPSPQLGAAPDGLLEPTELTALAGEDAIRNVVKAVVLTKVADLQAPPADAYDVWLRLHLLSHRLVKPHGLSLDGQFGLLTNVVWTSLGPCAVEGFEATRARARGAGLHVQVTSVDKFPRMTDYVIPSGVRIGDADRVRLGAHLAEGTTVMHEGFVNFNAGTLGTAMVEGRISAGVTVGNGSDVGGGASIMGTLSGGGKEVISVGENSLIGANAGIGISLGNDCVVAAGTYVTAGSKVTMPDGSTVKAAELSGQDGILFLTNSETGAIEARPRGDRTGIELNSALHADSAVMKLRWFVVLGLVVAGILVATGFRDRTPLRSEYCVAMVGDVRAQVDLEQGQWASLMAAIAQERGLSPRATTIAIATAFQESKIHNIDYGDRDSVGLFQQRPSQGWGSVDQIMDPHYSIGQFYTALAKVDGYESMKITEAAQRVQRSGFPGAYAQHEADSRALASALRGYSPAAFTCQINPQGSGSTEVVVKDVKKAFGDIEAGQENDRARFPLSGKPADVKAQGWAIAHYLVGNASKLGITTVTFQTKQWNAERSDLGWTASDAADATTVRVSTN